MDTESPILIVSDVHLGSEMARASELADFLKSTDFGTLILNGDILDNPNLRFLKPDHWALLYLFRDFAKAGKKVIWIAGNHDFFAKHFFKGLGLETHTQYSFTWEKQQCMVIHGHQYDKFLIMNPAAAGVVNRSYRLIQKIDGKKRHMSGFVKKRYKVWLRVSKRVAKGAIKYAAPRSVDYVFCGHTHDHLVTTQGRVTYINSGSWVENPCSYIVLKNKEIKAETVKF